MTSKQKDRLTHEVLRLIEIATIAGAACVALRTALGA